MTQSHEWFQRGLPLIIGDELWGPAEGHPAFQFLALVWGDPSHARYQLNQNLVIDVIQAAAAIEYVVTRLDAALDEADRAANRARLAYPDIRGIADPAIEQAKIEFINLVTWTRNLGDRLKRGGRAKGDTPLGLLPAMNPDHPTYARICKLYRGFNAKVLADAKRLANFGLHASVWPYPLAAAPLSDQGTVILRVPDRSPKDVYVAQQFTYGDGREARTYARFLLVFVADFMDKLLSEFEESARHRWTPAVPAP